ncbi:TetR/AcrR family transcriptional regulator [Streptomyces sp. BPTC-684]|uniref:TetR/AcrR family transcriptional regulator n=1 Tax=Streptomyces sp. BPTC-684 TaxID=3043734 RepID=UPI0024B0BEE0|nr:TetR/AcrR family transcriptional regulator [Streptomyces sp. BPTC-684]WHM37646.1 TetR/AcrR family transcriptional regulator [Streptomyces sp. BPTC-684]
MVSAADRAKNPTRTSVWLERGKPAGRVRRSDQPTATSLDRDRIIAESVRLLDADGPAKFSMRRLAGELGVTAMSLYWYVDTKDDLLELALDSVFGELRVPDVEGAGADADWRDQLRELAVSYRSVMVRHPWVSPLVGRYLNIGPRSMEFANAAQKILSRSGLPAHGVTGGLSAVFQFVYGFGTIEGHFVARCAEAGVTQDEYFAQAMGALRERPDFHEAMELSEELMEARGGDTVEEMRERDFVFALDILIAGIEAKRAV